MGEPLECPGVCMTSHLIFSPSSTVSPSARSLSTATGPPTKVFRDWPVLKLLFGIFDPIFLSDIMKSPPIGRLRHDRLPCSRCEHPLRKPPHRFQRPLHPLRPDGGAHANAVGKPVSGGEKRAGGNTDPFPQGRFVQGHGTHLFRHLDPEDESPLGRTYPCAMGKISPHGVSHLGNLARVNPAKRPKMMVVAAVREEFGDGELRRGSGGDIEKRLEMLDLLPVSPRHDPADAVAGGVSWKRKSSRGRALFYRKPWWRRDGPGRMPGPRTRHPQ